MLTSARPLDATTADTPRQRPAAGADPRVTPGAFAAAPAATPAASRFEPMVALIKSVFYVPAVAITLNGAATERSPGIYRSFLEIPLIRTLPDEEPETIGALRILDDVEREFTDHDCTMLEGFARLIVDQVALWSEASSDMLTGAMTRRAFTDSLRKAHAAHQRHGGDAVLVIFDLDHFKAINDTHGHGIGDAVLRQTARTVRRELRVEDSFGRIGGEEFAVLLENADIARATEVVERIRRAIERAAVPETPALEFTASFGLAALTPKTASADAWMQAADAALYRAKEAGRNRLCIAAPEAVALN